MITRSSLSVKLENRQGIVLPAHVEIFGEIDPLAFHRIRLSEETAMFCTKSDARNIAKVHIKKLLFPTADDPNYIIFVGHQRFKGPKELLRWDGCSRPLRDRCQCSVIVEHQ